MNLTSNQPAEWYHHCGHLPLDRFYTCLVYGDLSPLIISGTPDTADLAEAWGNIYAEYLDLNNDNETSYILLLQKDIGLLADLKVEVETALYFLSLAIQPYMSFVFREDIVDILRERDFDYPFPIDDRDTYLQSLESVANGLSSVSMQMELKEKEYTDYMKSKNDLTIDTVYFDKMLTRIARFRHVAVIRASEITVKEFVLMVQDYLDYYKSKQKKLNDYGDEG